MTHRPFMPNRHTTIIHHVVRCTNFHCGEKAKALRLQLHTIYTILYQFSFLKVQEDGGLATNKPAH